VLGTIDILISQLWSMWEGLVELLPSLVIASVFQVVPWIVARFASKIADKIISTTKMRPSLTELIDTIVRIGIWLEAC
jgi:hypothetical protein